MNCGHTANAYLSRSALYLVLAVGVCLIPFALAQPRSRGIKPNLSSTANGLSLNNQMPQTATVGTGTPHSRSQGGRIETGVFEAEAAPTPMTQCPATLAYITNNISGDVSVIDTSNNTVVATVLVEGQPYGVAVKPD